MHNLGNNYKFEDNHKWYNIDNEKDVPEIMIYDVVGDAWDGTTAKQFMKELANIDADTILVRINSPGGLVYDGLAIYNALKQFNGTVITRVDAIAASIASVIFMAGDVRQAPPASDVMIHKPWSMMMGDAEEMRKEADELDRVQNMIEEIYEKSTSMDREEITSMVNSTSWISGVDALEMGFATELLEDARIAACAFDLDILPGVPDRHKRMAGAAKKRAQEKSLRDEGVTKRDAKSKLSTASRDDGQNEAAFIEFLNKIGD